MSEKRGSAFEAISLSATSRGVARRVTAAMTVIERGGDAETVRIDQIDNVDVGLIEIGFCDPDARRRRKAVVVGRIGRICPDTAAGVSGPTADGIELKGKNRNSLRESRDKIDDIISVDLCAHSSRWERNGGALSSLKDGTPGPSLVGSIRIDEATGKGLQIVGSECQLRSNIRQRCLVSYRHGLTSLSVSTSLRSS